MLEMDKVALPTFTRVADWAGLAELTAWLPNERVVGLTEKPALETEMELLAPPPPQDVDHKARAMQAVARKLTLPPRP